MTFREQKKLECDIFLSSHASQYQFHDKWKPGQAYSPDTFLDSEGYKAAVARAETAYREWLAKKKENPLDRTPHSYPPKFVQPLSNLRSNTQHSNEHPNARSAVLLMRRRKRDRYGNTRNTVDHVGDGRLPATLE